MDFIQKTSTDKINRDLQNFGSRSPAASASSSPSSSASSASPSQASPAQLQGTSSPSASSGFSFASIFTPYTIGIIVVIILLFAGWFAWDWYKTHHKASTTTDTDGKQEEEQQEQKQHQQQQQPIGGDTVKPQDLPPDSSTPPPVVTTMSPMAYAKYQKDQQALQTALATSHKGGGSEPLPDDSAAGAGKAGWCYIGEDQGYGVCASVQPQDKCLSGKVFPTETECRQNII
jgi:hypothetical protein